jgi:1-phosphofructokinase
MIYTLTLNPAIDHTVVVDYINSKDVSFVKKTIIQAAGKGINISNALLKLSNKSVVVTMLAGQNGEFIRKSLNENGLSCLIHNIDGNTRKNIKVVSKNNRVMEFNETGPNCTNDDLYQLRDMLDKEIKPNDILILAGSLPNGLPLTVYRDLIDYYNNKGVFTILDASGDNLKYALEAAPKVIKPNLYELGVLFDIEIETIEDAYKYAQKLLDYGINEIIVTLGADGSLCVTRKDAYFVEPLKIDVENTVGAGDSFLAGYVYAKDQKYDLKTCLKYGTSVAASSISYEGTGPKEQNDVNQFLKDIKIKKLERV